MSVGFANAVAEGLRFNRVQVSFEPGWQTRGNGFVFPNGRPQGLITHHTGVDYGAGLSVLVNGRPDLTGPLCNCCTFPDGRIHVVAAHPANHAGASGGRSMGPLPVTQSFNRLVWGNEVMYPGTKPWTAAQYRSARVLAGVISGVLGRPNPEWCRGHFETSVSGKWDPGAGAGHRISFDMRRFRAEVWDALTRHPTTPEEPMIWELKRTPIKPGAKWTAEAKDSPDPSWQAIEDTITLPGPAGGWRGRQIAWFTPGNPGIWVQEAWWGVGEPGRPPAVVHTVPRTGQSFALFQPGAWEAPTGARFLVIRYAAPGGGSIGIETEH